MGHHLRRRIVMGEVQRAFDDGIDESAGAVVDGSEEFASTAPLENVTTLVFPSRCESTTNPDASRRSTAPKSARLSDTRTSSDLPPGGESSSRNAV
jgi:hypothetical protein